VVPTAPTVTTSPVTSIGSTVAVSGGEVTDGGNVAVTARGVCWSTTPNPTVESSAKTTDGTGIGTFTSSLTGLTPGTTYHVRAYATNSIGTGYGADIQFTTLTIPTLTTSPISSITLISASSGGNITATGGSAITARGVCWSTSVNPTIALSTKTSNGTGEGTFTSSITGLSAGVTYHVRAYATNIVGTAYGEDIQFATCSVAVIPTLTTQALSEITLNSAISGGAISSTGCSAITARGVCWSTTANPTVALSTKTTDGSGEGTFISNITGLSSGVVYHVRAYATNSIGTGYGTDIPFTTCTVTSLATVSTTAPSSITSISAISGGIITSSGCATVTSRGVCWSTAANPTTALSTKTTDGTGEGVFTSNITGLTGGTTYHVRAYATNVSGTAYGDDIVFTNPAPAPVATAATSILQTGFTANWNSSVTATGYRLDVSTDITFATFVAGNNNRDIGNLTSATVTGLTANTTYYYRVRAYGAAGTSVNSNIITTLTLPGIPTAPVATSASSIAQTGFTANWNISSLAAGYRLDLSTSTSFTTLITGYNNLDVGNVTSVSITGLTANTLYYYRIRAYNVSGTSTNSNTISTTTLINPPSAPVTTSATNITQTGFSANWGSTSTATGYQLDVSTNNSFSTFISGYSNRNVGNVTSFSVTGLSSNTIYYYRVRATNAGGSSVNSSTISVTTLPDIPPAPSANSASAIVQTSFTAAWNSAVRATGYRLDVATNSGFTTLVTGYNNKDIGNLLSTSVTGLSAKTIYYYRVKAYNSGGTGLASNVITLTTLTIPPASPSTLTVLSCNNLATLKWRKNVDPYVSRYRIYGGLSENPTTKIDSTTNGITDTLKVLSGLIHGRKYYFRVTAVNYDGPESPFSNQPSATIKTGVIPKIKSKWGDVLICSNLGDSLVSYKWYKGNSVIANATNQYYVTNKQPGIYNVLTIDLNGCVNSSNTVSSSGTKSLSVYPNPASVSFALKLNDVYESKAVVSILTSSGIKVMEFHVENANGDLLKEIPVNNLDEGTYIVQVLLDNKDLYYTKIIVMK
jgi:phosphodiesterase/alkaline phosphatase D-like protein